MNANIQNTESYKFDKIILVPVNMKYSKYIAHRPHNIIITHTLHEIY